MIESNGISYDEDIPNYKVNLFEVIKWNKKRIKKKIKSIIEETIKNGVDIGKENKKSEDIKTKEDLYNIIDKDNPLKFIRKNIQKIKEPKDIFTNRQDMPQLKAKDAKDIL